MIGANALAGPDGPAPMWSMLMNWAILVVAGLFEIGWATDHTEGFTRPWPTVGTVLSMIISVGLFGLAMKALPVGTAYAVWVGVEPLALRCSASSCSGTGHRGTAAEPRPHPCGHCRSVVVILKRHSRSALP